MKSADRVESSVGETLKKIRKNKNYTQRFITDGILSQSTYSKVEAGLVNPTYSKFVQILKRLDMTEEEFAVLHNPLPEERDLIIRRFFSLNYNNKEALESVKKQIKSYLREHTDVLIQDLEYVCEAMLFLTQEGDYVTAGTYAKKVWRRLEKFDRWYLMEYRLINTILFVFPLESVLFIADRIQKQLAEYDSRESRSLMNNLQINISLVLIRNEQYEDAIKYLNLFIEQVKKEHQYYLLTIAYMRKAVALSNLGQPEAIDFYHKSKQLVTVFDNQSFSDALDEEWERYTNKEKSVSTSR